MAIRSIEGSLDKLGPLKIFRAVLPATANPESIVTAANQDEKLEVIGIKFVKTNAAAGAQTATLQDTAANAITDAISINDADAVESASLTLDDANATILPGEGLQVAYDAIIVANKTICYVTCLRTA